MSERFNDIIAWSMAMKRYMKWFKDLFIIICLGCVVCSTIQFLCSVFGWSADDYTCGWFSCLAWMLVIEVAKSIRWIKK